jgi:rod shape-determining protein MreD
MKYFIYITSIIILLGINLGLFGNLQLFSQIPNLLLLFTLCASLDKKKHDFFFIAFTCGIFLDFFSASFFGGFTFSLLLIALVLSFLSNTLVVLELNWKSLSLLLFGTLVMINLTLWVYGFFAYRFHLSGDFNNFKTFSSTFVINFLYNWLLLYPIFIYYNYVRKIIDGFEIRGRGVVR